MINFLACKTPIGETTLYLLSTAEEEVLRANEIIRNHPQWRSIKNIVVRNHVNDLKYGFQAEAVLSKIIARRNMWALYDENLRLIGNGTGNWATWQCKSPLINNEKLFMLVLHYLEMNLPLNDKQQPSIS